MENEKNWWAIGSILAILFVVVCYAFILLCISKKAENYWFLSFNILLFVVIYCVSILDYRITGSNIGIEKAVKEINVSRKEIEDIAVSLFKVAHILADGTGRMGGMPDEHKNKILSIQEEMGKYINPNLSKDVKETIDLLNKEIEERTNTTLDFKGTKEYRD